MKSYDEDSSAKEMLTESRGRCEPDSEYFAVKITSEPQA